VLLISEDKIPLGAKAQIGGRGQGRGRLTVGVVALRANASTFASRKSFDGERFLFQEVPLLLRADGGDVDDR
jgi:hypothetical protein